MSQIPQEQRLILLRDRLLQQKAEGRLGIVAVRTNIPEWVLFDWCSNSLNTPTLKEIDTIQDALDNKKRAAPQTGDAASDVSDSQVDGLIRR